MRSVSMPTHLRWVSLTVVMLLVGGLLAFASELGPAAEKRSALVATRVQATPAPTPAPTSVPATPEPAPVEQQPTAQPQPQAAAAPAPNPAPPSAVRDTAPSGPRAIGRLELPRIGVSQTLYEGVEMSALRNGPGLWPGKGVPGEPSGNAVVAGHRTTNTRPFRHIDKLREGDEIIFHTDRGRSVYRVTEYFTVREDEMWIARNTTEPITTLFACHPPGSARYRYVVRGELEDAPEPASGSGSGSGRGSESGSEPEPTPTPTPRPGLVPFD